MSEWTIFDDVPNTPEPLKLSDEAKAKGDAVKNLASKLHDIRKEHGKEPDWHGMLLNAKDQHEKFQIRNARDAYQQEQKVRVWEEQKRAYTKEVDDILSTPQHLRNKDFYDKLRSSRFYFDDRIAKQRKKDQESMGLAFHLKVKGL